MKINQVRVSSPSQYAPSAYPDIQGLNPSNFQLPPEGLPNELRKTALNQLSEYLSTQKAHYLGYQDNQNLNYAEDLHQYLDCHINNISDPFISGNLTTNTKVMERAVLDYYASLWNASWPHDPHDPDSYWGYVLSMGSTEGNLHGLCNGRDYLSGKILASDQVAKERAKQASLTGKDRRVHAHLVYQQAPAPADNPNAYTPIAFFSEDSHYSVFKAMRILGIPTFHQLGEELYPDENPLNPGGSWPYEVPSLADGSIDINALEILVEFFAAKGYPILINFNYGTTFKGAYDNVEAAGKRLIPIFKRYNLYEREIDGKIRNGFWFHVDGALGAAYMPFVEMAYNQGLSKERGPNFDFRLSYVHSITMSGHKWNGSPWPCGVFMTKVKYQLRPPDIQDYVASPDTTLSSSRNGFSALILWNYLATNSYDTQIERFLRTQKVATYACEQLEKLAIELGQELWVEHNPLSLSLHFKRVNEQLISKYSLSNATYWVQGEKREYSNIFIMEHVTETLIDDFIEDLRQDPYPFPCQIPLPDKAEAPSVVAG